MSSYLSRSACNDTSRARFDAVSPGHTIFFFNNVAVKPCKVCCITSLFDNMPFIFFSEIFKTRQNGFSSPNGISANQQISRTCCEAPSMTLRSIIGRRVSLITIDHDIASTFFICWGIPRFFPFVGCYKPSAPFSTKP